MCDFFQPPEANLRWWQKTILQQSLISCFKKTPGKNTFLRVPPFQPRGSRFQEPSAESGATGLVAMMQVGGMIRGEFSNIPLPYPNDLQPIYGGTLFIGE